MSRVTVLVVCSVILGIGIGVGGMGLFGGDSEPSAQSAVEPSERPESAPPSRWIPPRPVNPHPRQAAIDRMRASLIRVAELNEKLTDDVALIEHQAAYGPDTAFCTSSRVNTCVVGEFRDEPDTEDFHVWSCLGTGTVSEHNPVDWSCLAEKFSVVRFEGDTAYYGGGMSPGEYREFISSLYAHGEPVTKLVINSGGGPTEVGKLLGLWVYENGIDVQVRELCFSSCANYIFTAGRNKYIEEDALVAWHGTPLLLNGSHDASDEERLRVEERNIRKEIAELSLPDPEKAFEDALWRYRTEFAVEREFYAMIGVDPLVTTFFGVEEYMGRAVPLSEHQKDIEALAERTGEFTEVFGDTFSVENMALFGIDNVTYLGDGRYPGVRQTKDGDVVVELGV